MLGTTLINAVLEYVLYFSTISLMFLLYYVVSVSDLIDKKALFHRIEIISNKNYKNIVRIRASLHNHAHTHLLFFLLFSSIIIEPINNYLSINGLNHLSYNSMRFILSVSISFQLSTFIFISFRSHRTINFSNQRILFRSIESHSQCKQNTFFFFETITNFLSDE